MELPESYVNEHKPVCDDEYLGDCEGPILWPGPGTNITYCKKHMDGAFGGFVSLEEL